MGEKVFSTSIEGARRLAVTKQHLAGELPARPTRDKILSVIRDLPYVQWDPISVVAPSHILSLWSRLGDFRLSDLDRLLWDEKKLFEHWAHAASIVLTEDYPLYYSMMRRYPESLSKSWGGWRERARKFLAEHGDLRKRILIELKKGPCRLDEFEDYVPTKRSVDGWTSGSDVSNMLSHLQMQGQVMIVGHEGNRNIWGLSGDFLPASVDRTELSEEEFERQAAERAIRAIGTASPREINLYFVRGHYHNLRKALNDLQEDSTIHRVRVEGLGGRDERYVHDRDVSLLEAMDSDAWRPRMSLLAPFDNLISAGRTDKLFGFHYVHEQFLPKDKRKFGFYVLPILWGDRFIGRVDPEMDKRNGKLLIHSIHAEPGASGDREVPRKIGETIERLAGFLGAEEVEYPAHVPSAWKKYLR